MNGEAAHKVVQPVQRGIVGVVNIVENQQARLATRQQNVNRLGDALEKTALSNKRVGSTYVQVVGMQSKQRWLEPAHLRQPGAVEAGEPLARIWLCGGLLEQRRQRRVGQRCLALEAVDGDDGCALARVFSRKRRCQRGLTDAGFALDDDQLSVVCRPGARILQGGPGALALDQRGLHGDRRRAQTLRRAFGTARQHQLTIENSLVQRHCLGQGRNAEFLIQDAHTLLILANRGGALAVEGVELHQLAMGRLVQRIDGQPAPRIVDGRRPFLRIARAAYQRLQEPGQVVAISFGLEELPVVKRRAVAQGEAGEKITVLNAGRFGQVRAAGLTGHGAGRWAVGQATFKGMNIAVEIVVKGKRHLLAFDVQPGQCGGGVERRECTPQRRARTGLVKFGPEQSGKRIARVGLARDGQIGEQCRGLARVGYEWFAVEFDAWRAKQVDCKLWQECPPVRLGSGHCSVLDEKSEPLLALPPHRNADRNDYPTVAR